MKSFTAVHYAIVALSVVLIVLGMWMLSTSLTGGLAITAAPILLAFVYLVLIPAGLLWPSKKVVDGAGQNQGA